MGLRGKPDEEPPFWPEGTPLRVRWGWFIALMLGNAIMLAWFCLCALIWHAWMSH